MTTDDIFESPQKYGAEVYDDVDELAHGLDGSVPIDASKYQKSIGELADEQAEREERLDAAFWAKVKSEAKYGR